jgi:PPP family 3-phenylpropionic acid transporter
MSRNPQKYTKPSTGKGFALRLKVFYAALFITLGVQLPFLPVWFAAKGLDAQAIGIALAVPMLVRVFAIAQRLGQRCVNGQSLWQGIR